MSITSLTRHNSLLGPFAIIQTSVSSHLPLPSSGVLEPSFAHGSLPEKSIILIYFPGTGEELKGLALSLPGSASQLLRPLQRCWNQRGLVFSQGQETLSELCLGFYCAHNPTVCLNTRFLVQGLIS